MAGGVAVWGGVGWCGVVWGRVGWCVCLCVMADRCE